MLLASSPWRLRNPFSLDRVKVAHDLRKLIYVVQIDDMSIAVSDDVKDPVAYALALIQSGPALLR